MPLEKQSSCKVNLLLNILGKRPDGYHELESVMHPVRVHDTLSFERQGTKLRLKCSDPLLPTNAKNLVYAAAECFLKSAGITDGVRIHLEKRIPVAAGLGGGSGNAATTLLALNELFDHPLTSDALTHIASSLGSDIPFFLQDRPALATGRGEVVTSLEPFPALAGAWLILVHPGFGISTPWAYQQLASHPAALHGQPGRAQRLINVLGQGTLADAAKKFYNSLESSRSPQIPIAPVISGFLPRERCARSLDVREWFLDFTVVNSQSAAETLLEEFKLKFGESFWTTFVPL